MKVAIPSKDRNPTLESELEACPHDAASLVIYNTGSEETVYMEIDPDVRPCEHIEEFTKRGITDLVSNACCMEHFQDFRNAGITVWKASPAVNIRDMINNFLLCGAWVVDEKSAAQQQKDYAKRLEKIS